MPWLPGLQTIPKGPAPKSLPPWGPEPSRPDPLKGGPPAQAFPSPWPPKPGPAFKRGPGAGPGPPSPHRGTVGGGAEARVPEGAGWSREVLKGGRGNRGLPSSPEPRAVEGPVPPTKPRPPRRGEATAPVGAGTGRPRCWDWRRHSPQTWPSDLQARAGGPHNLGPRFHKGPFNPAWGGHESHWAEQSGAVLGWAGPAPRVGGPTRAPWKRGPARARVGPAYGGPAGTPAQTSGVGARGRGFRRRVSPGPGGGWRAKWGWVPYGRLAGEGADGTGPGGFRAPPEVAPEQAYLALEPKRMGPSGPAVG